MVDQKMALVCSIYSLVLEKFSFQFSINSCTCSYNGVFLNNGSVNCKRAHPPIPPPPPGLLSGIVILSVLVVGNFSVNLYPGVGHLSILKKADNVVCFSMRETLFSLAPTRTLSLEFLQITYPIKSSMHEIIVVQGFCLLKIKISQFPKVVTGTDLRGVLHVFSSD